MSAYWLHLIMLEEQCNHVAFLSIFPTFLQLACSYRNTTIFIFQNKLTRRNSISAIHFIIFGLLCFNIHMLRYKCSPSKILSKYNKSIVFWPIETMKLNFWPWRSFEGHLWSSNFLYVIDRSKSLENKLKYQQIRKNQNLVSSLSIYTLN